MRAPKLGGNGGITGTKSSGMPGGERAHPQEHPLEGRFPRVRNNESDCVQWSRGGCGDSSSCPFDGDPLNCCHAARLSRRGWESRAVEGAGLGRAGRGEGDAPGGKGLPLPLSIPSLLFPVPLARWVWGYTPGMCSFIPGSQGSTCSCGVRHP